MSETMTGEIRQAISDFKSNLKGSGADVASTFAAVDAVVEAQIQTIEAEVAAGQSPVPVHDYADVAAGRIDEAATAQSSRVALSFSATRSMPTGHRME